tara:strand:- start:17613 stop:18047 length:435 start_codon:yes stop_codon:yes gene_type:complete
MDNAPQNYENHVKRVPIFFVSFLFVTAYLLGSLYQVVTAPSLESIMSLIFAVGVMGILFMARAFPLGVQDRVIRLEERLRLESILGPEQRDTIAKMDTELLIGLRFASDSEVAGLLNTILEENIKDRKEVKKRVKAWRADHQRI